MSLNPQSNYRMHRSRGRAIFFFDKKVLQPGEKASCEKLDIGTGVSLLTFCSLDMLTFFSE